VSSHFIPMHLPQDIADSFTVYFEHVHPLYPFMDVNSWQVTVSRPDFHRDLDRNKPWYCLYHAVLALGCQHAQGGSFEAGKSSSWGIFSLALAGFSDLLLLPDSLIVLQALMAMSLYGLGVDALAIEHVILSEAARRAQSMSKMQFSGTAAHIYRRTFWMLYNMEKVMAFHFGRSSVSSLLGGTVFLPLTKYRPSSTATLPVPSPKSPRPPKPASTGSSHRSATPASSPEHTHRFTLSAFPQIQAPTTSASSTS
jgi:transcription factor-like protein